MSLLKNLKLLWRNRKAIKAASVVVDAVQEGAKMGKLKSRKLWAAIIGSALTVLLSQIGVPNETVQYIVGIVIAYIAGQSYVDAKK